MLARREIAFLAAVEVIGKPSRRYIAALSELRNALVHDVRHSEFRLAEWIAQLSDATFRSTAVAFSPMETMVRETTDIRAMLPAREHSEQVATQARLDNVYQRAREHPKEHIWMGGQYVLVNLSDMKDYSEYRQWLRARHLFEHEQGE